MRRAIAGFVCVVFLVGSCAVSRPQTQAWNNGELSFMYPADWTLWGPDEPIVLRRPEVLAYLGNVKVDVDSLCEIGTSGASCHFMAYDLRPGGVVVGVIRWQVPGEGPGDVGELVEVGGMAARFTTETTDRGTELLTWRVDDPYSSYLLIWGEIQGPGEVELRTQVRELIRTVAFAPVPSAQQDRAGRR